MRESVKNTIAIGAVVAAGAVFATAVASGPAEAGQRPNVTNSNRITAEAGSAVKVRVAPRSDVRKVKLLVKTPGGYKVVDVVKRGKKKRSVVFVIEATEGRSWFRAKAGKKSTQRFAVDGVKVAPPVSPVTIVERVIVEGQPGQPGSDGATGPEGPQGEQGDEGKRGRDYMTRFVEYYNANYYNGPASHAWGVNNWVVNGGANYLYYLRGNNGDYDALAAEIAGYGPNWAYSMGVSAAYAYDLKPGARAMKIALANQGLVDPFTP